MKLQFAYTDPLQLSETLQAYGQVTRITQLESGEGSYRGGRCAVSHAGLAALRRAPCRLSSTTLRCMQA